MPPKGANRRQQEIAAKVQEMKAKQQRWMNEKRLEGSGINGSSTGQSLSSPLAMHKSGLGGQSHVMNLSSQSSGIGKRLQQNISGHSSPDHTGAYEPGNYGTPYESSDDYGSIADSIINRVKNNLGVSSSSYTEYASPKGTDTASPTSHPQPLSSHMCCKCKHLMVGPHHNPMMLVPCGHNLCEACCRNAVSCYSCKSDVNGHTPNVMLEQIIVTQNSSQSADRKSRRTGKHKDEEDDTETLLLRREAMQEEFLNIEQTIRVINYKIQDEIEQIYSIEEKEAGIINEIAGLQRKLVKLHEHKDEFREKISTHQLDITSEKKKIELINQTLKYLTSKLNSQT